MMIHIHRFWLLLPLVLTISLKLTDAQVTFTFEKTSCHYAGESLVLVAKYTGGLTVTQVNWYFQHKTSANLLISDLVACIRFGAPVGGYPNDRMNFTCDTGTNIYKANIFNLDGTENGEWGVIFSLSDGSTTTLSKSTFTLCTGCNVPSSVNNADINATGTVQENVVATVTCNEGFVIVGTTSTTTSMHTCQSDGTWVPVFPSILCERDCKLWICFIGLIVTIALCGGKLSLYFFNILEFKCIRSIEFGVKIVSPAAVICLVGILLAILPCLLSSGCDDDKGWATGVNAVLVIVCPCGSVGIIIVHFKFTDDKAKIAIEKTQEHADENRTNGLRVNKVYSTTS